MATLTIRNLDDKIRDFLRQQAARHGRSMEAEVRFIIEQTVARQQTNPGKVARKIQERFAEAGGADDLVLPERAAVPEPENFVPETFVPENSE